MSASHAQTHAVELIRRISPTPDDGGCQAYLETILTPLGFVRVCVDAGGVTNSIYTRSGEQDGTLAFAGHTDVVPPGPADQWTHPPYAAVIDQGMLHGRGAQDMKSAIACWLAAVESLHQAQVPMPTIQLLITSDEEGESIDGTVRITEYLEQHDALPDAVIVGEPSSVSAVGDTIRRGRRGVVHMHLNAAGKQGHSAYPQDANNAIHHIIPALARILAIDWGEAAADFPPTSCAITNMQAGTGAANVIPGIGSAFADIRYNPSLTFAEISHRIQDACGDDPAIHLDIRHEAETYYTPDGSLLNCVCESIVRAANITTTPDTGGGTSDGRFLAAAGIPVVELGLTNSTIHQVNERVALHELDVLTRIYTDIITNFERIVCH